MQDKLGFGGAPYIRVFSFDCQLLCLMNIVWSLSFSLICMRWFYTWANFVSMIVRYYLLPRYTLIPTLPIFIHDSLYYLIISLVSIDFLINCHTCFTLFSRDLIIGLREVLWLTHHHTFPISNLTFGSDFGFP